METRPQHGSYGLLLFLMGLVVPLPFAVWLVDLWPWIGTLAPIDRLAVGFKLMEVALLASLALMAVWQIRQGAPTAAAWMAAAGGANVVNALYHAAQVGRLDFRITAAFLTGRWSMIGLIITLNLFVNAFALFIGAAAVTAGTRRRALAAALSLALLAQLAEHQIMSRAFYEPPAAVEPR